MAGAIIVQITQIRNDIPYKPYSWFTEAILEKYLL